MARAHTKNGRGMKDETAMVYQWKSNRKSKRVRPNATWKTSTMKAKATFTM